ncbi:MAG: alpha/beta fold hydrolase [Rhizobiaceae bacterium]
MNTDISFRWHSGSGGRIHYAEIGDSGAPLIICLHGFPEYWAGWHEIMIALSPRYHVVAPDQRGFNLSFKPQGAAAYHTHHMVTDLVELADELSPDKPFILAGHDWGAAVAYAYAIAHPERLSHLVIANGVHPACFQRAIFDDPDQRAASQYINRLRSSGMEKRMAADNYARTLNMIEGFSHTDWMNEEIRKRYIAAWSQPGAMQAMLNWYRSSPIIVPAIGEEPPASKLLQLPDDALAIRMPHLVVWGEDDEALRPSCLEGLDRYAADLTIERISGTGHWILHERPEEVAEAIDQFVNR